MAGNREYTLIDTEPQPMKRHVFALDQRPTGERFRQKFHSPPSRMSAMMARASYASRRSIQSLSKLGMAMATMVVWPARMTQRKVPKPATRGSRVDVQERDLLLPRPSSPT